MKYYLCCLLLLQSVLLANKTMPQETEVYQVNLDTVTVTALNHSIDDIVSFCKYIKTQQNDPKQYVDMVHVIGVMVNRVNKTGLKWSAFTHSPKANSSTIRRLVSNQLTIKFDTSNYNDRFIYEQVELYLSGRHEIEVPPNLLMFENCKGTPPSCFKNFYKRFTHRFYFGQ